MPKDKEGKYLTGKEYMSRWKQGILDITPYQQSKILLNNTWVVLFGIVCGLVVTLSLFKTLWWLEIVLLGALGNTIATQVSNYQKYVLLKKLEGGQDE